MAVTLITGTSTGIGLATALHLASRGHQVYASMRNLNRARALQQAAAAKQLALEILELDVDDERSVQRAVRQVLAREGQIDVLVNNAGIATLGAIERTSDAMARAVFETNFFGALRTIRAVLPSMRERRSGTIVNVSSVAGRVVGSCIGVYPASKFALEAASEALAQEVRPFGIRVAIVEPGFIVTPILDKLLNSLPLDSGSPYADAERRTKLISSHGQATGSDPCLVAETIEYAVTTTEPKLRYLVGPDAQALATSRARMSDEEWTALGRQMTDEEFFQEFNSRFAMPAQA